MKKGKKCFLPTVKKTFFSLFFGAALRRRRSFLNSKQAFSCWPLYDF
jgi:hypothetical protein